MAQAPGTIFGWMGRRQNHPEFIDGLVIWASYSAGTADISGSNIPVASIYGSRDLAVNDASIAQRAHLLPEDTRYVRIEGGDHHQFGSYEIKPDEQHESISRDLQYEQIIRATLAVLRQSPGRSDPLNILCG